MVSEVPTRQPEKRMMRVFPSDSVPGTSCWETFRIRAEAFSSTVSVSVVAVVP